MISYIASTTDSTIYNSVVVILLIYFLTVIKKSVIHDSRKR